MQAKLYDLSEVTKMKDIYVYQTFLSDTFKEKYHLSEAYYSLEDRFLPAFEVETCGCSHLWGETTYFFRGELCKLKVLVEEAGEEWNEQQLYNTVTIDESFNRATPLELICHSIAKQLDSILNGRTISDEKKSTLKKCTAKERAALFCDKILPVLFSKQDLNRIGFYIHVHQEFCYALPEPPTPIWHMLKLPFQVFLRMNPIDESDLFEIKGISYVLGKEIFNYYGYDGHKRRQIHSDGIKFNHIGQPVRYNGKITSTMTGRDYLLDHEIKELKKKRREAKRRLDECEASTDKKHLEYYSGRVTYFENTIKAYEALRTLEIDTLTGWYKLKQ